MARCYLDHAATTPTDPAVLERMLPYFRERFGNPSSIYRLGRQSFDALDAAHERVAAALYCRPTEVVFTGGGSEADNLAIKGVAFAQRRARQAHRHQRHRAPCRDAHLPAARAFEDIRSRICRSIATGWSVPTRWPRP